MVRSQQDECWERINVYSEFSVNWWLELAVRHFHDNENEPDRISVSDETSYWLAIINSNQCGWPVRASVWLYDLTFDLSSLSPLIHVNVLQILSDGFDEYSRLTQNDLEANNNNWKLSYTLTINLYNHKWLIWKNSAYLDALNTLYSFIL